MKTQAFHNCYWLKCNEILPVSHSMATPTSIFVLTKVAPTQLLQTVHTVY